ncbi:ABC transporter ATP-binding protein (plasmid) [Aggregatilineales bacterium SYSU G02658]
MGNLAINVSGLSKLYRIGAAQQRQDTLRELITQALTAPLRRARALARGEGYGAAGLTEELWALKDVSFEVKHGEVVGIIGRNGAGKSTLLKILSRITQPTAGRVELYGRVGALLEVGTGFHGELTGRENIYLNGAILGMSRAEIDRKFDEIVAFSGVERFIDTPVKHYSSGMGLRLGFAVAAHLEPEILIVDEVLAVGDAEFQKKCLGKMKDVAGEGRTVLFVSHNMAAVEALCHSGILLEQGRVMLRDTARAVIDVYLSSGQAMSARVDLVPYGKASDCALRELRTLNRDGVETLQFRPDEPITFEVILHVPPEVKDPQLGIAINNWRTDRIVTLSTKIQGYNIPAGAGEVIVRCEMPPIMLAVGTYRLRLVFGTNQTDLEAIDNLPAFEIVPADIYGTGRLPNANQGAVYTRAAWSVITRELAYEQT